MAIDFFEDWDENDGIFRKPNGAPEGSHGDPDAVEDINGDFVVAPMQFSIAPDGIPAPHPPFDAMAIMNAPVKVSEEELVCLAGPCTHYVEVLLGSGVTKRYCTLVRSWAEPTDLAEVDVLACSGHGHESEVVSNRIKVNHVQIALQNSKTDDLGLCYTGCCAEYFVQIIRGLDHEGEFQTKYKRYCNKLAGAARPMELLSYEPVRSCTSLCAGLDCGIARDARVLGELALEKSRRRFAKEEDGVRDSGPGDNGDGEKFGGETTGIGEGDSSADNGSSSGPVEGEYECEDTLPALEDKALPDPSLELE